MQYNVPTYCYRMVSAVAPPCCSMGTRLGVRLQVLTNNPLLAEQILLLLMLLECGPTGAVTLRAVAPLISPSTPHVSGMASQGWNSGWRESHQPPMPRCVDCGLSTGNFCEGPGGDLCLAAGELLQLTGRQGRPTPLCTACERAKGCCKYCRFLRIANAGLCTPTPGAGSVASNPPGCPTTSGDAPCSECQGRLDTEFFELTDSAGNPNFNYQALEGGPRHADDCEGTPIIYILQDMKVQLTCARCKPDVQPRLVNWASFNENQIGLMQAILSRWALANASLLQKRALILNLEPYLLATHFFKAITSIYEMAEDRCDAHWFSKILTCCAVCHLGQQHSREVGGGEDDLFYKALEEYKAQMEEVCGVKLQLVERFDQDSDTIRATCVHQSSRVRVLRNDKMVPFEDGIHFKHYTCTPTTMTDSRIISGAPWELVQMELRRRAETFKGNVPEDCLEHEVRVLDPRAASAYWTWAVLDGGLTPLRGQQGPCCGCGCPTLSKCKCLMAYFCVDCANLDYFTVPLLTESIKVRTSPLRGCRRCINEAQKALGLR